MNALRWSVRGVLLVLLMWSTVVLAQVGVPDPLFGVGGKTTVPFGPEGLLDWSLADVAIQDDGLIIVVGSVVETWPDIDFGIARLSPDGQLDPGFGVGGEQRVSFNLGADDSDLVSGVALQPDGKIVVVGSAQYTTNDFDFAIARLNPDGQLDAGFGVGGTTTVWFDLGWSLEDVGRAAAIQPDGKIVLAGAAAVAPSSDFQMAVARLDPGGNLDPTFGTGGKVIIAFDLGGSNYDVGFDVALQTDGKIVVAGWADTATSMTDFAAVRLNENGTLDGAFGTGGKVVIPFDLGGYLTDEALAVAIQPDGKIVMAGAAEYSENADHDFAIARLHPSGTLDASFGVGGKTTVPFDMGGDLADIAYDVALQADGKIVVAGTVDRGSGDTDFAVARLLPDGWLDTEYGPMLGRTVIPFDLGGVGQVNFDDAYAAAIQGDHKVVVAGVVEEGVNHDVLGVVRLTTDLIHVDGFDAGNTLGWSETVPPSFCVVFFDDAYASFGQGADPEWFYGPFGVHFDNSNGYGLIGGMGNGDPGDWDIEGTHGSAAWGLWGGFHSITFEAPVVDVTLDLLRGHEDHVITLEAYLGGGYVGSETVTISGPFDSETIIFPGPIDLIVWDEICCYGMDRLVYTGLPVCP